MPAVQHGRGEERGVQQDDVRRLRMFLLLQVRERVLRLRTLSRGGVLVVRPRRHRRVGAGDERGVCGSGEPEQGRAREGRGGTTDAVPEV